ncbi:MAG: PEP-CTERM sorting domain-containing protein [Gemmataceae bacterium]
MPNTAYFRLSNDVSAVSEPTSLVLLGSAAAWIWGRRIRRRRLTTAAA